MSTQDAPRSVRARPAAAEVPRITRVGTGMANAYLVESDLGGFVLVDAGPPGATGRVLRAVERRFGPSARPHAIVLTHGHLDHAGGARALARRWGVPVYAHPMELPFLDGRSPYPPSDPTVGGPCAMMARFLPDRAPDLGVHLWPLPANGSAPHLPGWRWIATPGHTPGHVSLLRTRDGALLAGDAVTTQPVDAWSGLLRARPALFPPPAPFTTDWVAAHASVRLLADLAPTFVAAGHGAPIGGPDTPAWMRVFADGFAAPTRGRYAHLPAVTGPEGVRAVPPPVPDFALRRAAALLAVAVAALVLVRRRRRGMPT